MTRTFYLSTALITLLSVGAFNNIASAQETAQTNSPEGQTDQSEEDWRNENKTTSKKIEDIVNPDPNSGGNGWGITLPPLDDMDQLPAESQKHLKRERNKVIGKMNMKTGEMGDTAYKPSPAAEDDPSLQAEEQAVWEKMIGDLKGAAKSRSGSAGSSSGAGKPGDKSAAGSSGVGSEKVGSKSANSNGSSGPAPQSILGRSSRRSASDMMRGGKPGVQSRGQTTETGSEPGSQPEAIKVAERNTEPHKLKTDLPGTNTPSQQGQKPKTGQAEIGQASGSSEKKMETQNPPKGTAPESILPKSQGSATGTMQEKGAKQEAAQKPQGSSGTPTPQPNVQAKKNSGATAQKSATSGSRQKQAENQGQKPTSNQSPQNPASEPAAAQNPSPPVPPKPSFMSFLRKLLGGKELGANPPAPNPPATEPKTQPSKTVSVSAPSSDNSETEKPQITETVSSEKTETAAEKLPAASKDQAVQAPSAPIATPLPTSTDESLEDLIGIASTNSKDDYEALEALIKLSTPTSP